MKERRYLTTGEEKLARFVFGDFLNYRNIQVVKRNFKGNNAITPFGNITFPSNYYKSDFVGNSFRSVPILDVNDAHWFLHELVHVWQHYVGMRVIVLAITSRLKPGYVYNYTLEPGTDLLDYNVEQQGDIIADYFAAEVLKWAGANISQPVHLYQQVLANFINDPKYPMEGRWMRKVRAAIRGLDR
jgi:hypothetical protein